MHTALYRKYRPKTFADVIGQKYVVQALKNQIENKKIGHAFLFTGTRGTGKTSCAKIFAKAVNCQNNINGEPCLTCDICKGIENASIYDVVEMDAASNNSVEDIRDLLHEVNYLPVFTKYRVYIIDEVHMLSQSAFNALLKTLEEPPKHVIFILATTELHKVPATIISRCQKYDFTKLTVAEIGDAIIDIAQQENLSITKSAAEKIAILADGAMRDASSILETCVSGSDGNITDDTVANIAGSAKNDDIFLLCNYLIENDMPKVLQHLILLENNSVDLKRMTQEVMTHIKNLILSDVNGANAELLGVSTESFEKLKLQSQSTTQQFLYNALAVFAKSVEDISIGQTPKIALDMAIYKICNLSVVETMPVFTNNIVENTLQKNVKADLAKPIILEIKDNTIQDKTLEDVKVETKKHIVDNVENNTSSEEGPIKFVYWQNVINIIENVDIPFHSFIKNSKAYLYKNIVYIDGNEGLNNYIRTNKEASAIVKKAILDASGKAYNIGGYRNLLNVIAPKNTNDIDDILKLRENGVEVNIKD